MIVEVLTEETMFRYEDATAEIAGTAFVVAQKNKTTIFSDGNWVRAYIIKEEDKSEVKLD